MNYYTIIHLLHILFLAPLALYVGIEQTKVPSWIYTVLFYLGIYIILFHLYKTIVYVSKGINPWINVFHLFLVAPFFLWLGIQKEKTPSYVYQILLMLGFATLGYHSYHLFF